MSPDVGLHSTHAGCLDVRLTDALLRTGSGTVVVRGATPVTAATAAATACPRARTAYRRTA